MQHRPAPASRLSLSVVLVLLFGALAWGTLAIYDSVGRDTPERALQAEKIHSALGHAQASRDHLAATLKAWHKLLLFSRDDTSLATRRHQLETSLDNLAQALLRLKSGPDATLFPEDTLASATAPAEALLADYRAALDTVRPANTTRVADALRGRETSAEQALDALVQRLRAEHAASLATLRADSGKSQRDGRRLLLISFSLVALVALARLFADLRRS